MLNTLLISPSGIGKTEALEYMAIPLLLGMPEEDRPFIVFGKTSPQRLVQDLAEYTHLLLYAEELAALFTKEKFQESLIPCVTKILNYLPVIEERTKTGGVIRAENPSGIVFGGSTAEWLQDQLPNTAISGGFLARFLICNEAFKGQKVFLPRMSMGKAKLTELADFVRGVEHGFCALLLQSGEADLSGYDAADIATSWYNNLKPVTGHLAPFAARGGEFSLRLAMICALSRKSLVVRPEDIRFGITLWEYCQQKLQDVVVPLTGKGKTIAQILKVIGNDEMTDTSVGHMLRNYDSMSEIQKLINDLLRTGDLTRTQEGKLKRKFEK
jgi:hypothetical protein